MKNIQIFFPNKRELVNPCFEKDLIKCPNFETALQLEIKMLKSASQLRSEEKWK